MGSFLLKHTHGFRTPSVRKCKMGINLFFHLFILVSFFISFFFSSFVSLPCLSFPSFYFSFFLAKSAKIVPTGFWESKISVITFANSRVPSIDGWTYDGGQRISTWRFSNFFYFFWVGGTNSAPACVALNVN